MKVKFAYVHYNAEGEEKSGVSGRQSDLRIISTQLEEFVDNNSEGLDRTRIMTR